MCSPIEGKFCSPQVHDLVYATAGDLTPIPRDPSRRHLLPGVVEELLKRNMLKEVNCRNGRGEKCLRVNFEQT